MLLEAVLRYLVSNPSCSITGDCETADDWDNNVTWLSDDPKPTWDEIQAAKPAVEQLQARKRVDEKRRAAYTVESDPLYFEWQRGEGTEEAWTDKVAEIRARYPYPA